MCQAPTVDRMTSTQAPSHRTAPSKHALPVRAATATIAMALLSSIASPVGAVALRENPQAVGTPILGDVVTCVVNGENLVLTGVSGSMVENESTRIDRKGRARVLFTIRANHALLADASGATYQLIGRGYDRVLYPTAEVTGEPTRESIRYRFDVIGDAGRVGVVRFALTSVAGAKPTITDTSTCQIPEE